MHNSQGKASESLNILESQQQLLNTEFHSDNVPYHFTGRKMSLLSEVKCENVFMTLIQMISIPV